MSVVVHKMGLEPTKDNSRQRLKLMRLPIPPPVQDYFISIIYTQSMHFSIQFN